MAEVVVKGGGLGGDAERGTGAVLRRDMRGACAPSEVISEKLKPGDSICLFQVASR